MHPSAFVLDLWINFLSLCVHAVQFRLLLDQSIDLPIAYGCLWGNARVTRPHQDLMVG